MMQPEEGTRMVQPAADIRGDVASVQSCGTAGGWRAMSGQRIRSEARARRTGEGSGRSSGRFRLELSALDAVSAATFVSLALATAALAPVSL